MRSSRRSQKLPNGQRWIARCFEPIDIASLVYFRIAFGALMVWEMWRYLAGHYANSLWTQPEFHFKYFGFEWVQPPPGNWIYVLFAVLLVSAIGITIGFCYRVCSAIFAIGFTWLFLVDAAQYLNHFYLICLISFVSVLLPANRRLAVDSFRKPSLRSDVVPAWTLLLPRAQMAIVYIYGGIAKLNTDWLHGEPVRTWLASRVHGSTLEGLLGSEWTVGVICYGGLLFDLFIVPLLLWRKTRMPAFALAVAFHLANNWLFSIGVFPWLAIALTALFFPPDWPRLLVAHFRKLFAGSDEIRRAALINHDQFGFAPRRSIVAFLVLYLSWQLLMPLRHFLYPGTVSWTEEGHRFSWHMKLRSKTGETKFFLLDPATTEVWSLDPLAYLTSRQKQKMDGHPDLILQFASYIAGQMAEKGRTNIHIHVIAHASLNGRQSALLIDPDVNLAAIHRSLRPASWILPLGNKHPNPAWVRSAPAATVEGPIRNSNSSEF